MQRHQHPTRVNNAVDGSYLVEVDLVQRSAMDTRLGNGQLSEDLRGLALDWLR